MVSQVRVFFLATSLDNLCHPSAIQLRCTAPQHDLEGVLKGPRSHLHTETLMHSGTITLRELWDDYGIVGDILVSDSSNSGAVSGLDLLAIYISFPACRHSRSPDSGSLTSAHQRHIQGPRRHLGRTAHQGDPPCSSGRQDPCRY